MNPLYFVAAAAAFFFLIKDDPTHAPAVPGATRSPPGPAGVQAAGTKGGQQPTVVQVSTAVSTGLKAISDIWSRIAQDDEQQTDETADLGGIPTPGYT